MVSAKRNLRPLNNASALAGPAAAIVFLLMQVFCDRLIDPFRPFSHSTATLRGSVRDNVTAAEIEDAVVTVDGTDLSATTDNAGTFRLSGVPTGKASITITSDEYHTFHSTVDVTLEPPGRDYRLARVVRPPAVGAVIVDTGSMRFFDDSLTVVFKAADSFGGITKAVLHTGDTAGGEQLEMLFDPPVDDVVDSFTFAYSSRDTSRETFHARLMIIDARGDTGVDSFTVLISKPRRPTFALIRTGPKGFITGEWENLQVNVADPDSLFSRLSIDWGDGSDTVTSQALERPYWHKYQVADPQMPVTIRLFGKGGLLNETLLYLPVKKISPPLLDNKLFFKPSQYCAPHDSVILIGVRILEIKDDYAAQIIWIVNENDPPSFAYHRDSLGAETGAISDSIGNLFVHRFSTAGFKGTNIVEVRVVDNADNSGTVSGTFFITGRAD